MRLLRNANDTLPGRTGRQAHLPRAQLDVVKKSTPCEEESSDAYAARWRCLSSLKGLHARDGRPHVRRGPSRLASPAAALIFTPSLLRAVMRKLALPPRVRLRNCG